MKGVMLSYIRNRLALSKACFTPSPGLTYGSPLPPNGSVRLSNGRLTIMILGAFSEIPLGGLAT